MRSSRKRNCKMHLRTFRESDAIAIIIENVDNKNERDKGNKIEYCFHKVGLDWFQIAKKSFLIYGIWSERYYF